MICLLPSWGSSIWNGWPSERIETLRLAKAVNLSRLPFVIRAGQILKAIRVRSIELNA